MTDTTHPVNINAVPTQQGYDLWAEIYDSEDNPLILMEEPRVRDLLGPVRGLHVADIGCGTGRHALQMARDGADVTAVDFSQGMLDQGRRKAAGLTIRWIQHDLHESLPLRDGAFDRVINCLVLEHIRDLNALFAELGRICKPDGAIVISAMHPAMMLKGTSARFTDPATGRETRPQSYPHQISDFVNAALQANLKIDHISEGVVDEAMTAKSPRSVKYLHWPMLFVMRLRRADVSATK